MGAVANYKWISCQNLQPARPLYLHQPVYNIRSGNRVSFFSQCVGYGHGHGDIFQLMTTQKWHISSNGASSSGYFGPLSPRYRACKSPGYIPTDYRNRGPFFPCSCQDNLQRARVLRGDNNGDTGLDYSCLIGGNFLNRVAKDSHVVQAH